MAPQGRRRPTRGHPALHPLQRRLHGAGRPSGQDHLLLGERGRLPRGRVQDHQGGAAQEGRRRRRRARRHGGGAGLRPQRSRRHPLREA